VLIRELPATITAELKGLTDIVQIGEEQRAKFDVAAMERRQFAYGVIGVPARHRRDRRALRDRQGELRGGRGSISGRPKWSG
jgi:hypothetical protein